MDINNLSPFSNKKSLTIKIIGLIFDSAKKCMAVHFTRESWTKLCSVIITHNGCLNTSKTTYV